MSRAIIVLHIHAKRVISAYPGRVRHMFTLLDVCGDNLADILAHLPGARDVLQCAQVCKTLYTTAQSDAVWRALCVRCWRDKQHVPRIPQLQCKYAYSDAWAARRRKEITPETLCTLRWFQSPPVSLDDDNMYVAYPRPVEFRSDHTFSFPDIVDVHDTWAIDNVGDLTCSNQWAQSRLRVFRTQRDWGWVLTDFRTVLYQSYNPAQCAWPPEPVALMRGPTRTCLINAVWWSADDDANASDAEYYGAEPGLHLLQFARADADSVFAWGEY